MYILDSRLASSRPLIVLLEHTMPSPSVYLLSMATAAGVSSCETDGPQSLTYWLSGLLVCWPSTNQPQFTESCIKELRETIFKLKHSSVYSARCVFRSLKICWIPLFFVSNAERHKTKITFIVFYSTFIKSEPISEFLNCKQWET